MSIKTVEELVDRGIYLCDGVVKDKARHFQVVHTEADEEKGNNAIIVLVPCIGGMAIPVKLEGVQQGLDSGELTMELVEAP